MNRARVGSVVLGFVVLAGIAATVRRVSANAPPGQYVIGNDGTVLDTRTHLTWQQALPVAQYSVTWAGAKALCVNPGLPGAGWRVPSVTELQTLVDESKVGSMVDDAFGASSDYLSWTSTPLAGDPTWAWTVYFHDGDSYFQQAVKTAAVRCVR
jgi:hypothetical protein